MKLGFSLSCHICGCWVLHILEFAKAKRIQCKSCSAKHPNLMRAILGPRPYEAEEQLALLLEGQGRTSTVSECIKYHPRSSRIWSQDVSSNEPIKQSRNQAIKPKGLCTQKSTNTYWKEVITCFNAVRCRSLLLLPCPGSHDCDRLKLLMEHTLGRGTQPPWTLHEKGETPTTQPSISMNFEPHLEKVNMPFS